MLRRCGRAGALVWLGAVAAAALRALPARGSPFALTDNRPFAARCNGPLGAIVIRDQEGWWADAKDAARQVQAQHSRFMLERAARPLRLLAARGVIRGPVRPRFPRVDITN